MKLSLQNFLLWPGYSTEGHIYIVHACIYTLNHWWYQLQKGFYNCSSWILAFHFVRIFNRRFLLIRPGINNPMRSSIMQPTAQCKCITYLWHL